MLPRKLYQFISSRSTECLEHLEVIAARLFQRLRKRIGVESDAIDPLLKILDGLDQAGIAAQFEKRLVEVQIGVEHGKHVLAVDRCAVLPLDLFELSKSR